MRAEEPATKTENGTFPAVGTEKAPAAAAPVEKVAPAAPKADMDKVSYVIGLTVGREMKAQGVELKTDAFVKGLNDSLSGAKPSLTDAETREIMASFRAGIVAKQEAEMKKQGAENREKRRGLSCRKQGQGWCPDPAERPSI